MPIKKICSRCGTISPSGQKCQCLKKAEAVRQKYYDQHKRNKDSKRFYDSQKWKDTRDRILRADGIDVYVYMTQGKMIPADTVHHIIPLREDISKGLSPSNLMSLSHDTHSFLENLYKVDKAGMIEKLTQMLKDFRAEQKVQI